jgi:DNA-binding beta-propeller fold protein YncE
MTLNSSGTLAYVVNRTKNSTSVCNVSGQVVNNCNSLSGSNFNEPEGIIFSPEGRHVYITNAGDKKVVLCDVREDGTGLLEKCETTNGVFDGTGNIGLNNSGTFAYVPNELLSEVFICNVGPANGDLSECKRSHGTGFVGPSGVVVR